MMVPPVVIRPIELLPKLVNHRAPSDPDVMPIGEMLGSEKLETFPAVVIRPIESKALVNQSAPSGPAVMPHGFEIVGSV